jgi:type I restriction enzyme S subunit
MSSEGWEKTALVNIIEDGVKNGYSPVPSEEVTGYWVLGLGAITDNGLNQDEIKPVTPSEKVMASLLSDGDFLISRSNTPEKVGRSIRFKNEILNCSYPDLMMKFRVDTRKADPTFIEHKLKSHELRSYFKKCAAGSSSTMVKINKKVVENALIKMPSIEEQKKIADILSSWVNAIATTEKVIVNSQKQKKALMQQLLTGKNRLPGFSGEWKEYSLGEIFSERVETRRENLPLLSITASRGVINQSDSGKKDTSNDDKSKYRRICVNDIGYNTMRMWQGRSSLSDKEGIVSPAYTIVTPCESVSPDFAAYMFKLPKMVHTFYRNSQGMVSDTWNLKYSHFKKIKWLFPKRDEQEAIANILKTADKEIGILKNKKKLLEKEKKSLMQQLLTGKKRVNTK